MFNVREYKENGYAIINNVISKKLISQFNRELKNIFPNKKNLTKPNKANIFANSYKKNNNRKTYYALMQDMKSVKSITYEIDKTLDHLNVYNRLGFKSPSIKNALIVSLPKEKKFDNPLHQDIYNNHSNLFIKIWAPLTEVGIERGSMELFKKSHNLGFIPPNYDKLKYYPEVNNENIKKFESNILTFKPGPIVVFNPFILHRSIPNVSEYTRFVIGCDIQDISKIYDVKRNSIYKKMLNIKKKRTMIRKKINY